MAMPMLRLVSLLLLLLLTLFLMLLQADGILGDKWMLGLKRNIVVTPQNEDARIVGPHLYAPTRFLNPAYSVSVICLGTNG